MKRTIATNLITRSNAGFENDGRVLAKKSYFGTFFRAICDSAEIETDNLGFFGVSNRWGLTRLDSTVKKAALERRTHHIRV